MHYSLSFPTGTVDYYLNTSYSQLLQIAPPAGCIIVTDQHINRHYADLFSNYRVLSIKAGESSKNWETLQLLAAKLASFEAHKKTTLIGIGGGVITDITGFLASVYMRGVSCGFVPTSLLGMVDAAIGGKNGINIGLHKNMTGAIRQPRFILYDISFLTTLPDEEWSNGLAEVIKYGCITEPGILDLLQQYNLQVLQQKPEQLNRVISGCIDQKNRIVQADEQETGERKILNFGHTAGHAFETIYQLPHGQAVGLGMLVALIASEQQLNLDPGIRNRIKGLLQQYNLPVTLRFDVDKVMETLRMDKKRDSDHIDFILLESTGKAVITPLSFDNIRTALQAFSYEYKR